MSFSSNTFGGLKRRIIIGAEQLGTEIGERQNQNGREVLSAPAGNAGILACGPFAALREGFYETTFHLNVVGKGKHLLPKVLGQVYLLSSSGGEHFREKIREFRAGEVKVDKKTYLPGDKGYDFVVSSNGLHPVELRGIELTRVTDNRESQLNVEPFPEGIDRVLHIGLPRSGSHWLYRMISDLLDWKIVDDGSNITLDVHGKTISKDSHKHYMLTHERAASLPNFSPGCKVIFQTRDFRDAITSLYFNWKAKGEEEIHLLPKKDAISRLIERWGPIERKNREFFRRNPPEAVVLYEDLFERTEAELSRIGDCLGIQADSGCISRAVHKYSFKAVTGRRQGEEDSAAHARKGTPGDWKNHLAAEHLELITSILPDGFSFRPV